MNQAERRRRRLSGALSTALLAVLCVGVASAQFGPFGAGAQQQQQQQPNSPILSPFQTTAQDPNALQRTEDELRMKYVLGPNDQIILRSAEVEEINDRPFRVDENGFIELPLVGRLKAAGLSIQQLEQLLAQRYGQFVLQPQVSVNLVQFRGEPVFLVGAYKSPGVYLLEGKRSLIEMITAAGGLAPTAGQSIHLARRMEFGEIPLPNAKIDAEKKLSTVDISMKALRETINPPEDILLRPYDVITVAQRELVYLGGFVGRAGGYDLGQRETISLSQAVILAGGFPSTAKDSKVRVLRPVAGTTRRAVIEVNGKKVFQGKANDFPLQANDVVYVPRSTGAVVAQALYGIAIGILPWVLINQAFN